MRDENYTTKALLTFVLRTDPTLDNVVCVAVRMGI